MRTYAKFDDPDGPPDPAYEAVNEAGGGEAEGFELAEQDLIEHASHGDEGGTARITADADANDQELLPGEDLPGEGVYGEADEEHDPDLADAE